MDEKLKPCPFCGAPAQFYEGIDEVYAAFVSVRCTRCGCGGGMHFPLMDDAKPNAANEWNRRAPDLGAFRRGAEAFRKAIADEYRKGQCDDAADFVMNFPIPERETDHAEG